MLYGEREGGRKTSVREERDKCINSDRYARAHAHVHNKSNKKKNTENNIKKTTNCSGGREREGDRRWTKGKAPTGQKKAWTMHEQKGTHSSVTLAFSGPRSGSVSNVPGFVHSTFSSPPAFLVHTHEPLHIEVTVLSPPGLTADQKGWTLPLVLAKSERSALRASLRVSFSSG